MAHVNCDKQGAHNIYFRDSFSEASILDLCIHVVNGSLQMYATQLTWLYDFCLAQVWAVETL